MTTLNFLLAHAVGRTLEPGDEIVVTQLDHDANVVAVAARRAKTTSSTVHTVPLRAGGRARSTSTRSRRTWPRPHEVVRLHAGLERRSARCPTRARIADLAHAVGALAWADGVHYAPHRRIDLDALGARRAALLAVQVLRPAPGRRLRSATTCSRRWPADRVRPADETPAGHRFETGTPVARGAGRRRSPRSTTSPRSARAPTAARAARRAPSRASPPTSARSRLRTLERLAGHARRPPARHRRPRARRRAHADVLPHARPASRRARPPRRSAARASSRGTATTTRSRRSSRLGLEERRAARCAPASSTTRRRRRSTASSTGWRPLAAAGRLGYESTRPRGCGGIGRRARFRSVWAKGRGGSSPLIRT